MDNPQRTAVTITLRVPPEVAEAMTMKRWAREHERSLTGELVRALREYMARQEQ